MEELGMKTTSPQDRKQIGVLLAHASKWSLRECNILLSALVHRQGPRETMPSAYFFGLARQLSILAGKTSSRQEERAFLRDHMEKIFKKAKQMKYEGR